MRATVTDMGQFKQNDLDRLLSIFINYTYHCDNPTPIDKIYHYTKEEFPDYSEDELGKIIVASRLSLFLKIDFTQYLLTTLLEIYYVPSFTVTQD